MINQESHTKALELACRFFNDYHDHREIIELMCLDAEAALTVAPCATCEHYKRCVNPLVGIYDSDCFECKHYYASKYEQKGAT